MHTTPPDCVAEGRVRYLFATGRVRCLCTQSSESIQRFRDVRRGVSINTSANLQVDVDVVVELCYPLEHKYFTLWKLNSKHNL